MHRLVCCFLFNCIFGVCGDPVTLCWATELFTVVWLVSGGARVWLRCSRAQHFPKGVSGGSSGHLSPRCVRLGPDHRADTAKGMPEQLSWTSPPGSLWGPWQLFPMSWKSMGAVALSEVWSAPALHCTWTHHGSGAGGVEIILLRV